jgi:hypothetical protein
MSKEEFDNTYEYKKDGKVRIKKIIKELNIKNV